MTDYSRLSVDQRTIQQLMEKLLEAEKTVVANINQHSIMFETLTRCQVECTELTLRVRELETHNARLIIERDCANSMHVIRLGPGQSGDCDCGHIGRKLRP